MLHQNTPSIKFKSDATAVLEFSVFSVCFYTCRKNTRMHIHIQTYMQKPIYIYIYKYHTYIKSIYLSNHTIKLIINLYPMSWVQFSLVFSFPFTQLERGSVRDHFSPGRAPSPPRDAAVQWWCLSSAAPRNSLSPSLWHSAGLMSARNILKSLL